MGSRINHGSGGGITILSMDPTRDPIRRLVLTEQLATHNHRNNDTILDRVLEDHRNNDPKTRCAI